ncbi:MAG: hypothetical protein D6741_04930, partial [Planctomycetota bacterium]
MKPATQWQYHAAWRSGRHARSCVGRWCTVVAAFLLLWAGTKPLTAQTLPPTAGSPNPTVTTTLSGGQLIDAFDAPGVRWSAIGGDAVYREIQHRQVSDVVHSPGGAEFVAIEAGPGTAVYYEYAVKPAPVIDETAIELWVRADRPGVSLHGIVVLPHTIDPNTGKPLSLRIPGTQVRITRAWEALRVENFPEHIQRLARALRLELQQNIETRGAYLRAVQLNVYGGPGNTQVWIDDLSLAGYLPNARPGGVATAQPSGSFSAGGSATAPVAPPVGGSLGSEAAVRQGGSAAPVVGLPELTTAAPTALNGTQLLLEGKPFYPRAIEYQGESLETIRRLGFNTVWLHRVPDRAFLSQAAAAGLKVICPPPWSTGPQQSVVTVGKTWNVVIAWDLGYRVTPDETEALAADARFVRAQDPVSSRPLIAWPETKLREASRAVDIVVLGREPCGTSLELVDYAAWLRTRPLLARPGTPLWTIVQTQPDPVLLEQWRQAGADPVALDTIAPEQIRLLTYLSLAGGARGLLFRSHRSLEETDPATRTRAAALELVNRELDCIEPFLAGGQFQGMVDGSVPQAKAALFRVERGRLIAPLWLDAQAQYVAGQSSGETVSFVVPGVPDWTAYLLLPGSLEPIRYKRVTGGVRVTIDEFGPTSLVVLTQDPLILQRLSRATSESGRRMAELQRLLANERLDRVRELYRRTGVECEPADEWIRTAQLQLQWSEGFFATNVTTEAFLAAVRAERPVRLLERDVWRKIVRELDDPISIPTAVRFETLPLHRTYTPRVMTETGGVNRLPAGDFEDPALVPRVGWQHVVFPVDGVVGRAELASASARTGRFGLHLEARATTEEQQLLLDAPPVVMTSP